ncbi:hypothetical protein ABPG74_013709 [Tetrahymena malaccensis]
MQDQNIYNLQNGAQHCDLSCSNSQMYQQELLNHQFNQISTPTMYDQNTSRIQNGANCQNFPNGQRQNSYNQNQNNYVKQNPHKLNSHDLEMACSGINFQKTAHENPNMYSSNQNKKRTAQRYVPSSQPNTFAYNISKQSNMHIYWFSETPGYHTKRCCYIFYADDCFLKWIADLFFHVFFFPFKVMGILITYITRICCKGNNCLIQLVNLIEEIAYSPVSCFGSWVNQCWYSTKMFCCRGETVKFLSSTDAFDGCCQICCLNSGQCIKSCCSFTIDCKCCKALDCGKLCTNDEGECCFSYGCLKCGDCMQNLLTPQGLCENCFKYIQNISCDFINTKCIENICCCCIRIKEIAAGEAVSQITNCCCCVIQTIGSLKF